MMLDSQSQGTLDASANGPGSRPSAWLEFDWDQAEAEVARLRQRIFKAAVRQDHKVVRGLQKLMLRSRANAWCAVRRVTQVNAGRLTAGVDGLVVADDKTRAFVADWLCQRCGQVPPLPVRRVYVPKPGGKRRPLGIPVIADRASQAMVLAALEPEWEARFEADSYGFRPGRGCHDAIEAIFTVMGGSHARRRWVLDADLKAAFDHIDHDYLLGSLAGFPAREQIAGWLKAGVVEDGVLTPTAEGTPQGGVISPLLLNIALHGLEGAAGVRREREGLAHAGRVASGSPVVVRYADDLVALCETVEQVETVKRAVASWLEPRGLAFNEDKTKIVSINEGFDFLGFTIRRYPNGKLLTKPSRNAVTRLRRRLAAEVKTLRGANAEAVITRLNPIIRGWAAYYRPGVSTDTFQALDHYVWRLTWQWALHSHPNKPKRWVQARYFGAFHPKRRDRWVFGDKDTGRFLVKFSWTPIIRHVKVKGRASPDDPDLAQYWSIRRHRNRPPVGPVIGGMLHRQQGRCLACGQPLLLADQPPQSPDQWAQWLVTIHTAIRRKAISDRSDDGQPQLLHTHCAKRATASRRANNPTRRP